MWHDVRWGEVRWSEVTLDVIQFMSITPTGMKRNTSVSPLWHSHLHLNVGIFMKFLRFSFLWFPLSSAWCIRRAASVLWLTSLEILFSRRVKNKTWKVRRVFQAWPLPFLGSLMIPRTYLKRKNRKLKSLVVFASKRELQLFLSSWKIWAVDLRLRILKVILL